jgi:hypothetical protein
MRQGIFFAMLGMASYSCVVDVAYPDAILLLDCSSSDSCRATICVRENVVPVTLRNSWHKAVDALLVCTKVVKLTSNTGHSRGSSIVTFRIIFRVSVHFSGITSAACLITPYPLKCGFITAKILHEVQLCSELCDIVLLNNSHSCGAQSNLIEF